MHTEPNQLQYYHDQNYFEITFLLACGPPYVFIQRELATPKSDVSDSFTKCAILQ